MTRSYFAVVSAETGQWTLTIQPGTEPSLHRVYGPESVIWLHRDEVPDRDAVDRWLPEGWQTTGGNISAQFRCVFPVEYTAELVEQRYGVLLAQGGRPGTDGIYVYDRRSGVREEQVTGFDNLTRAMKRAEALNQARVLDWRTQQTGAHGWSTLYIALA